MLRSNVHVVFSRSGRLGTPLYSHIDSFWRISRCASHTQVRTNKEDVVVDLDAHPIMGGETCVCTVYAHILRSDDVFEHVRSLRKRSVDRRFHILLRGPSFTLSIHVCGVVQRSGSDVRKLSFVDHAALLRTRLFKGLVSVRVRVEGVGVL